jgi:hypothetical protein
MWAHWHMRSFNSCDALLAGGLLHQVIEKNPRDAKTLGGLSFLGVFVASWGWTEDQKTTAATSIADRIPQSRVDPRHSRSNSWDHGEVCKGAGLVGADASP